MIGNLEWREDVLQESGADYAMMQVSQGVEQVCHSILSQSTVPGLVPDSARRGKERRRPLSLSTPSHLCST